MPLFGKKPKYSFNCPRCKALLFPQDEKFRESIEGQRADCPLCAKPLKIRLNKEKDSIEVEPLSNIKVGFYITVTSPDKQTQKQYYIEENALPDELFQILVLANEIAKQLSSLSSSSILTGIQMLFDPSLATALAMIDSRMDAQLRYMGERVFNQLKVVYHNYPAQVRHIALNLLKFLPSYLVEISKGCPNCGMLIPVELKQCFVCNYEFEVKAVKEDPLTILKMRLAKGEITKEQYEEMKKLIEALK